MTVIGRIKKGAYFDSVTLMTVGKEVAAMAGVIDAAVVMGTKENKAILAASGLLTPEFEQASDTDLLIGVSLEDESKAEEVLAVVDECLARTRTKTDAGGEFHPMSLDGALQLLPDANLALISVAGRYAGDVARDALERGLHVMLFSDNVPLEKEVELKQFAREKGLLVMGPDCGTAIINGVPLAFANAVNRGDIGIVAAAGTGLQEVSTIISKEAGGVSQAIGTGGRDVKEAVGGIMFIEALKVLGEDDATKVILLVSKPPHPSVVARIEELVASIGKPVVSLFLGAPAGEGEPRTLEEAAHVAVALANGQKPDAALERLATRDAGIVKAARREAGQRKKGQRYVRGLFSGGTFCAEAQIIFSGLHENLHSNAPTGKAKQLADPLKSVEHTFVDLGEDEFTVGRPHPMIDYSLRNKRILQEAANPETAVILLDVVLGYGSNMDPVAELDPVIREAAKKACVVCSVTGTMKDSQNEARVTALLEKAGAIVMPSNAAACKMAACIIQSLAKE